jgi:hypothetical protein
MALSLSIVASADPVPHPTASMKASISPSTHLRPGTPLDFTLDTRFATVPPGEDFVLHRGVYLFPRGTVLNGRLFPSCDVATLTRAHGRLSACPASSKIGGGIATGTAVALGVTASGKLTFFNGPGGRSITMNVSIIRPALINTTFKAPYASLRGRYVQKLTVTLPDALNTVLGGDIITSYIHVTTGATRMVHGVRRGYIEASRCPRNGRAHIHADFSFMRGPSTSADTTATC